MKHLIAINKVEELLAFAESPEPQADGSIYKGAFPVEALATADCGLVLHGDLYTHGAHPRLLPDGTWGHTWKDPEGVTNLGRRAKTAGVPIALYFDPWAWWRDTSGTNPRPWWLLAQWINKTMDQMEGISHLFSDGLVASPTPDINLHFWNTLLTERYPVILHDSIGAKTGLIAQFLNHLPNCAMIVKHILIGETPCATGLNDPILDAMIPWVPESPDLVIHANYCGKGNGWFLTGGDLETIVKNGKYGAFVHPWEELGKLMQLLGIEVPYKPRPEGVVP